MTESVPAPDVFRFFRKVICDYDCGDVRRLLDQKTPTLGPLLACVLSGIDTLGGMMDGFGPGNSRSRSVDFMVQHMKFDRDVADVVYRCARCGYVHEGIGKLRLSWFADYERLKPGTVLYVREDGGLALDVVALAESYLGAVEDIQVQMETGMNNLRFLPNLAQSDEELFAAIVAKGLTPFQELADLCHERIDEIRGSHSFDDVLREVNYWQYEGYE